MKIDWFGLLLTIATGVYAYWIVSTSSTHRHWMLAGFLMGQITMYWVQVIIKKIKESKK